jgi:ParB family chromosome partitioning protein
MAPKKSIVHTLNVQEIQKNPILTLATSPNIVQKYGKVTSEYGGVLPLIACASKSGYKLLAGQARLEACVQAGLSEIPVVEAQVTGDEEQMKLALLLSVVCGENGALSEAELICRLIDQGVTLKELGKLLGKSKAWLSRRQALANNLSEAVKEMVASDLICARTAEEIAKLPQDEQMEFASNVTKEHLTKAETEWLVRQYRSENTSQTCKEAIIKAPLSVMRSKMSKMRSRCSEKRSDGEKIADAVRFGLHLFEELKTLILATDEDTKECVAGHLSALQGAIAKLSPILNLSGEEGSRK